MTLLRRRGAASLTAAGLAAALVLAPAAPGWTAPGASTPIARFRLGVATTLPPDVLPPLGPSAPPASERIGQRLGALERDQLDDIGALILDASGRTVYESRNTPKVPASTMKVLTSSVALDALGAETRFETKVVQGARGNEITLVGGGDPLLQSSADRYPGAASLEGLAAGTAAALASRNVRTVALRLDASLFGGQGWNPEWPPRFRWSVAPITALKVDHALVMPGSLNRDPSPTDHAGRVFAAKLAERGIRVSGTSRGTADAGSRTLASARSLPVSAIVEETLSSSDNDAAEGLLWQVALKRGKPADFASARAVLAEELRASGLLDRGMVVADGSGISARNRVTPGALARAIRQGVESPAMRHLLTGLPVAGATGTLEERFQAPTAAAARGRVRAKTGSIAGVDALAGYVVSKDGQLFTFAFMLNGTPREAVGRAWIDDAGAVLAGCGC